MTMLPTAAPDSTAVRVALWRALHVQLDAPPHVLEDEIGLRLAAPEEGWRRRPDMDPDATSPFRASIGARSRFIEDLGVERAAPGRGARPGIHARDDVPLTVRARGPRGASGASAGGEGRASKRDAFHQLFHAD